MNESYFKMWRSYLNNDIWKNDRTAWHIFEYFLGKCDYKTGEWTIDYLTMSEYLKIPKATLHKAIKRLKKAKMVNDRVNEKNTTFTITNWLDRQSGERDGERKVNAKETQSERKVNIYKEDKKERSKELLSITDKENLIKTMADKGASRESVERELGKFISYWTEKNISGTKERWQMEKTFEISKRLGRWFNNISKFEGNNGKRGYKI